MKRGEVWWVDFEPASGSELKTTHPAIIVSNDASNAAMRCVQIVPITSNVEHIYVFEAPVHVSGLAGKAMADQIMTAEKKRLRKRIGTLSAAELQGLDRALKIQLSLR
jgi:mRNA interferase MazF